MAKRKARQPHSFSPTGNDAADRHLAVIADELHQINRRIDELKEQSDNLALIVAAFDSVKNRSRTTT
jgi:hypothetical protein